MARHRVNFSGTIFTGAALSAVLALLFAALFLGEPTAVKAQNGSETGQTGQREQRQRQTGRIEQRHGILDGSYLDREIARRKSAEYNIELKKDLRRLYILVENYGNAVAGARQSYNEIKADYRQAIANWYQHDYLEAYRSHRNAREKVSDLYWQFVAQYRQQTAALLKDSSEKLIDAELAEIIEPEKIYRAPPLWVLRTSFKLQIAYGQSYLAEKMQRVQQPELAIQHYRLAKIFAIEVLKALELDRASRKAIENRYRYDLRDSKGILAKEI